MNSSRPLLAVTRGQAIRIADPRARSLLRRAVAMHVQTEFPHSISPKHHLGRSGVRTLSSEATRGAARNNDREDVVSLKSMVKPFFLKCHPDVQTSPVAKKVNLEALKTVNGFLDALEAACTSSSSPVVEWPSSPLEIEFMLSIEQKVKKEIQVTTSRRRVEVVVPPQSLRDSVVRSFGEEKLRAIQRLRDTVQHELAKVLKVAGLPVPKLRPLEADQGRDSLWEEALGWNTPRYGTGRRFDVPPTRPKTRYERSRDEFTRSFDWKRHRELYDQAVRDMYADIATEGKVAGNAARRQQVIDEVISRVRIAKDADIELVDQMVTLRRLSLLLEDHFDELYIEDMGRMWESLVIILTGEREFNTSGSALRKRKLRFQETGFRFTYGADDNVTIHIPIDFSDEELIRELDRNLWDFYNLIDDGMEDLYPRHWMH